MAPEHSTAKSMQTTPPYELVLPENGCYKEGQKIMRMINFLVVKQLLFVITLSGQVNNASKQNSYVFGRKLASFVQNEGCVAVYAHD